MSQFRLLQRTEAALRIAPMRYQNRAGKNVFLEVRPCDTRLCRKLIVTRQEFDDLAYTCEQLACEGKMVLVAALDGNFLRKPFPEVSQLISYSDEIKKTISEGLQTFNERMRAHLLTYETIIY
ncbi:hypothetical protein COOONC_11233 [Cooperia oncophora]